MEDITTRRSTLKFDLAKEGLHCILKPYQVEIMKHFWRTQKPMISREVHLHLQDVGGDVAKSRALVINFLNYMVDEGILDYTEATGKGGHHRIYSPKDKTEQKFRDTVYCMFHEKLSAFKKMEASG
ncbi:MAG: hypothetical protein KKB59_18230 [Spirochaetes bacterium]|nr:hypothetical protein [Spirochaetota bacterium]